LRIASIFGIGLVFSLRLFDRASLPYLSSHPFLFRILTILSPAGRALRVCFSNALITCCQPARRKPHQHHPSSKRRNQCVTTNKLWTAGPTSAFQLLRVSFGHRHRLPLNQ
jgi:hypothetical protein